MIIIIILLLLINAWFFRCLHYFNSSANLEIHSEDCGKLNNCAIKLLSEDDKWLSFDNYCRKERIPFVVYADLECALEETDKNSESAIRIIITCLVSDVHYSYDSLLSDYRFHIRTGFTEELRNLTHSL